jgi:hypothetical protein
LVSTFERWKDHIIEEKQMRSKALKVMQRLVSGALISTFERWRDHIHRGEAVEEEGFKSDAAGRQLKKKVSFENGFRAWSDEAA